MFLGGVPAGSGGGGARGASGGRLRVWKQGVFTGSTFRLSKPAGRSRFPNSRGWPGRPCLRFRARAVAQQGSSNAQSSAAAGVKAKLELGRNAASPGGRLERLVWLCCAIFQVSAGCSSKPTMRVPSRNDRRCHRILVYSVDAHQGSERTPAMLSADLGAKIPNKVMAQMCSNRPLKATKAMKIVDDNEVFWMKTLPLQPTKKRV